MARFNLYPEWKGEYPEECSPGDKCIWFTTYEKYEKWNGYKPKFIVILDNSNELRRLGYEKREMGAGKNKIGLHEYADNRLPWVLPSSFYTTTIGESKILSAFGLIDDITLGNWWTSTEVSPYRMEMVKNFSNWVKYQREISSYQYPSAGIREGSKNMVVVQKEGEILNINKVDLVASIEMNNQKYVYLGGELWGILKMENKEMLLIGGPETSDNFLKYGRNRFLASIK